MQTFMAKAENIDRNWYILDAADKSLGRVASEAARLLKGKHKVIYTPHVDTGDYIIVINVDKAKLTGNKLDQKKMYHHSGFPGGLTETPYRKVMAERPELAMEAAIKGMLPKNRLGRQMYRKLKVYSGTEHAHDAQKPEMWEF